ncbi:MAG TPA: hypothetical protein VGF93_13670 [Solirubrobacteraceae bacterium]
MKRNWLVVAALAVGLLVVGATSALAAGKKSKAAPTTIKFKVTCKSNVGDVPADGDDSVVPPVDQGSQYGAVHCGKVFGGGIQANVFKLLDTGDVQGSWWQYYSTGTIHGKFVLTPADTGPPSSTTTFAAVSYSGTATVTGGSGVYKKAKGKGTMKCASVDGVHFTCSDTVKVLLPAPASSSK